MTETAARPVRPNPAEHYGELKFAAVAAAARSVKAAPQRKQKTDAGPMDPAPQWTDPKAV
jgi:hypothetical protein